MALAVQASYPVGGIALNGWVSAYTNLPGNLSLSQAGAAYMVQADALLYVWSGTAWPASGQGFSLAGPVGPNGGVGPIGPANSLSIGTVQTGAPAQATITGVAPNQVLSLILPEGHWWTGTGAPTSIPSSMNGDLYLDTSGNGNVYQLQSGSWVFQGSLKGPTGAAGATGAAGPANSLAIGTVVNGGSAAATITGTAPSQTLNLTLPQGPTGATGPSAPDATAAVKGIIQLAGDLSGTAAAPTVPGLTSKASTATTISAGTGLTGGGDLSANRSLSVVYGTAASTSAQGNDTRITGAVQSTRQVISGTGLAGGGDLTADRTLTVVYGAAAGTAAQGNDTRLSDARTPAASTVPCDFVWVAQSGTRVTGVGDLAAGMYVGRAFTLTRVIYQFDTADASGSTTVECRRNAAQLASSVLTVTAANQADGTATDAARTATFTQAWAVGDRFALAVTAVGTTPGKGARVYLVGTWN